MLSHKFRTIFVHIPKTAGQSIESVFLRQHGLGWENRSELLLRPNKNRKQGPERLAHLYAREYVECGHISTNDFARYCRFSVVRNPYERAISEYLFRIPDGRLSIEEFLRRVPDEAHTDFGRHMAPQSAYLFDEGGRLLVDQVVRFERLDEQIPPLLTRIFGRSVALPHLNAAKRVLRTQELSRKALRLIFRRYEADFDLFGYAQLRSGPA